MSNVTINPKDINRTWKSNGLKCMICTKNPSECLGYVEIPRDHPFYDSNKDVKKFKINGDVDFLGKVNNSNECFVGFTQQLNKNNDFKALENIVKECNSLSNQIKKSFNK